MHRYLVVAHARQENAIGSFGTVETEMSSFSLVVDDRSALVDDAIADLRNKGFETNHIISITLQPFVFNQAVDLSDGGIHRIT